MRIISGLADHMHFRSSSAESFDLLGKTKIMDGDPVARQRFRSAPLAPALDFGKGREFARRDTNEKFRAHEVGEKTLLILAMMPSILIHSLATKLSLERLRKTSWAMASLRGASSPEAMLLASSSSDRSWIPLPTEIAPRQSDQRIPNRYKAMIRRTGTPSSHNTIPFMDDTSRLRKRSPAEDRA
jgi:hypothetical protein